jgi:ribosomal protein S18 acetylase RimI-like enzyme
VNRAGAAVVLRAAAPPDCDTIADIWCSGWRDGHLGNVPESLHAHRRLADFQARVPSRLAETTVATIGSVVVGFVMVHDDEIEQIYVSAAARGSGVATALLEHGERLIFSTFPVAWLAVVAGNSRARRFYERSGWTDRGALDYAAHIDGGTVIVPSRRYEKRSPDDR